MYICSSKSWGLSGKVLRVYISLVFDFFEIILKNLYEIFMFIFIYLISSFHIWKWNGNYFIKSSWSFYSWIQTLNNFDNLRRKLFTFSKLVAPITITLSLYLNPSISVNIWFIVSREWEGSFYLLFPPIESISSKNIIDGAFSLAFLNSSLTLDAPTPTNISSNSAPDL